MTLEGTNRLHRAVRRPAAGVLAGVAAFGSIFVGAVHADPSNDALAKLNELSRKAEQATEAMHSAQLDLNKKVQAAKGKLILCNIDPQIHEVFEITKLDKFFNIQKEEQAALQAF